MSPRSDPGSYGAVVSGDLAFAGVDQGIDFTGTGSVLALGDGVVTKAVHSGSGWPGKGALLVYRLTSGPRAGRYVYVAEDYSLAQGIAPGAHVKAGQVLGSVHSSYPGIEMGWADSSGHPVAPLNPNPHSPKPAGQDFNAFVKGLAGAAANLPGDVSTSVNQAAGCASTLALMALACASIYAATGAPWPW